MSTPPQCKWACNDPTCSADCKAVAEPANCSCPSNPELIPNCTVTCPEGTPGIQNSCPACEAQCQPLPGCTGGIQCGPVVAGWACRKPECAYPTCELNCEQPVCPWTGPDPWTTSKGLPAWAIVLIVLGGLALFLEFARQFRPQH